MGNGKLLGKSNELLRSNRVMNWLPTQEGAENQDKCQLEWAMWLEYRLYYTIPHDSLLFIMASLLRFYGGFCNKIQLHYVQ